MSKDDEIIEMARQAGICRDEMDTHWAAHGYELKAFAKLVAAKEREACAKVCGKFADEALVCGDEDAVMCFEQAEDAIRARGENT